MRNSRKYHKQLGLAASVFILVLSITGILLNHPEWYSDSSDRGVTNVSLPYENGFLIGTENGLYWDSVDSKESKQIRLPVPSAEVSEMYRTSQGVAVVIDDQIVCFNYDDDPFWVRLRTPPEILSISHLSGDLQLTTNKGIYRSLDSDYSRWEIVSEFGESSSFKKTLLVLHSGLWVTPWMVYAHDISALILIFLVGSGFWIVFKRR